MGHFAGDFNHLFTPRQIEQGTKGAEIFIGSVVLFNVLTWGIAMNPAVRTLVSIGIIIGSACLASSGYDEMPASYGLRR